METAKVRTEEKVLRDKIENLIAIGKSGILKEPQFHKEFEQHQMWACVQDKIRQLPEPYRTVLILFDLRIQPSETSRNYWHLCWERES